MSVYDLYQSYLNQIQNPVVSSPVVDPTQDPLYLLYLQQLQQQQGGGDGQTTAPSYSDPNVGPGFQDYEAQAYGIGPTFSGSIAKAIDAFSNLPTPVNLGIKGIQAVGNFLGNMFGPQPTPVSEMYGYTGGSGDTGSAPGAGDPNASMGDTGMATGGDGGGVGSSSDAGAGSTDSCGSFRDGGYVALGINPKDFK